MTTDCIDNAQFAATEQRLHDAVVGLVVAVIFILPATLAAFAFL